MASVGAFVASFVAVSFLQATRGFSSGAFVGASSMAVSFWLFKRACFSSGAACFSSGVACLGSLPAGVGRGGKNQHQNFASLQVAGKHKDLPFPEKQLKQPLEGEVGFSFLSIFLDFNFLIFWLKFATVHAPPKSFLDFSNSFLSIDPPWSLSMSSNISCNCSSVRGCSACPVSCFLM